MSDISPNLSLPYLLASQAQKHVTLNESLNLLDALLMLNVKNIGLNSPPNSPNEGERFIIGDIPTGSWVNMPGQIAAFQNLGWSYIEPKTGFIAFCEDDEVFHSFNGQNWQKIALSIGDIQNAKLFGLGTTADTDNPFSLKANNALFSSKYASESGSGDIIFKLNKESQSKKAAFLFQNNWSGRAEFGLIGSDDFSLKMSSDGANFVTALTVKPDGKIGIGQGASSPTKKLVVDSDVIFNGLEIGRGANNDVASTALGYTCLANTTSANSNTAAGYASQAATTTGVYNCSFGTSALQNNTTGSYNYAFGYSALQLNTSGSVNIALGFASLYNNTIGGYNIALGHNAMSANITGGYNVSIGNGALQGGSSCTGNIAIGSNALNICNTSYSVAIGTSAGRVITSGTQNVLVGTNCGYTLGNGFSNTAIGYNSLFANIAGQDNVSVGVAALYNATASSNVAIGNSALLNATSGAVNTAIGHTALSNLVSFTNATGVGFNAQVTGSNQVQLGDSATTTYVFGTVQSRSDKRDKTEIRETVLGLDFINRLTPVDYKWDYRDDYREPAARFEAIEPPARPNNLNELGEGDIKRLQKEYEKSKLKYESEIENHEKNNKAQQERNKLKNIVKDGSKARGRYHSGLIAQDVKQVLDDMGLDWAAYQDHSVSGGEDVKSLGYTQFIAPLIRAIQELSARIDALNSSN